MSMIARAAALKTWAVESRRWRHARGGSGVRPYYGMMGVSARGLRGGAVKYGDLHRAMPNAASRPNLLYLVSSALPPFPGIVIERARAAGAPFVLNQNGVAYPAWQPERWQETNKPIAAAHAAADFVIYQSRFCRASAERFLGPSEAPSMVLHNAVDTEVFRPAARKPGGGRVILCAGTHMFRYRALTAVDTLAAARRSLPDARLLFAGRYGWKADEQDAVAELKRYSEERGLADRVEIRGAYTQAEAPALLQSAHVLLHTTYNDSCPRLVVEAMACGLPVVYSATGGTPELVGEDAGRGVPGPLDWDAVHPPRPEDLAGALVAVFDGYERYARGARARATASFSLTSWLARHQELFLSLLGERGKKGRA
jgi:glycosyltransferase involved in cell wall biosynthesis